MMKYFYLLLLFFVLVLSCKETSIPEKTSKQAIIKNLDTLELDPFILQKEKVSSTIMFFLEEKGQYDRFHVLDELLYSSVLLPKTYSAVYFNPIWLTDTSSLLFVDAFIQYIKELKYHGLDPSDYHLALIEEYRRQLEEGDTDIFPIAALEVLLSDAFLMMSSHLYNGKINPESIEAEWGIQRQRPELMLNERLLKFTQQKIDVELYMHRFYPKIRAYPLLVSKAKTLETDSIGTNKLILPIDSLPIDLNLDSSFNVPITESLIQLGFIEAIDSIRMYPNATLISAIKNMQKTFGLNPDGKIGVFTLEMMNLSKEEKLKKLYVNMERMRWLPEEKSEKRVLVNIADFTLDYLNKEDTILHMKTVVGRNFRQTPVFEAEMTYLVFSPTWTIPQGILFNDVVPAVRKDRAYLKDHNMVVLDRTGKAVDPSSINWSTARQGRFPFIIRQMPGDKNALGRVKFMFPNKYSVYLHDTPTKSLFEKDERTFSSGCIRISKPADLAFHLLQNETVWTQDSIQSSMQLENEKTILLPEPVGVYIYYLTAWGHKNTVHFRKDIYKRDDKVFKALKAKKYPVQ